MVSARLVPRQAWFDFDCAVSEVVATIALFFYVLFPSLVARFIGFLSLGISQSKVTNRLGPLLWSSLLLCPRGGGGKRQPQKHARRRQYRQCNAPEVEPETWRKLPGSPACLCARFLALVSWCPGCVGAPGLWPSVPILFVCLVVLALLCRLVSSSGSVSKRGDDPGHQPKDWVFSDRPTTCRAGSPWWSGMRDDDPRADPLAGTSFYARHDSGTGPGCWVLTLVFIVASSFFVFPSSLVCSNPPVGAGEKTLHVQSGLSVEVVRLFLVVLTLVAEGDA